MLKSATEIFKKVKKQRKELVKKSTEEFEKKCSEAIDEMIEMGDIDTEIEMSDDDFWALDEVTSKLSSLGIKYCLIERVEDDEITYRFRLSVAYLEV